MWSLSIRGVDFYHLLSWFFIYSFLGWVWETILVSAQKGELVNRGFINGPFCTIYGCGAISVYLILKPVSGNLLWLFFGGVVIVTLLEYVTAVLMERIFHTSWWDYSDKKFNFHGHICLGASVGWGFCTILLFRVLQPFVERIVELCPVTAGEIVLCVIMVVYAVDFGFSAAAAFHLHDRIPVWEQALDQLQGELLMKVREKMNTLEHGRTVTFGGVKEKLEDAEILKELEQKRYVMFRDISAELQKRKLAMAAKASPIVHRYVKSYPNLNRGYKMHHKNDKAEKKRIEDDTENKVL